MLQSVILVLLILKLVTLLEADEDVLVTLNLVLQLLMASLRLLDLQVQRLDISLNLLYPLDYLLLKDLLAMSHVVRCRPSTTLPSALSVHRGTDANLVVG